MSRYYGAGNQANDDHRKHAHFDDAAHSLGLDVRARRLQKLNKNEELAG
ncbi:MAG: hypothetical protein KDI77_08540 [Gammaproteobacteria bacterium]|nr:hypothetical protein [Gammaproteobacteria bacterium]